jgi:hypothetical protein
VGFWVDPYARRRGDARVCSFSYTQPQGIKTVASRQSPVNAFGWRLAASWFCWLYVLFGNPPGIECASCGHGRKNHVRQQPADFTLIPDVVIPGILVLNPDCPENMNDRPFFQAENVGTISGASQHIFLANAVDDLLKQWYALLDTRGNNEYSVIYHTSQEAPFRP